MKPSGYLGSVPKAHECATPYIFHVSRTPDDFTIGDVWECRYCNSRWIIVRTVWVKYWTRYDPKKHGEYADVQSNS